MESNLSTAEWVKARASTGNGACVEATSVRAGEICVRNSRDPEGPVLRFTKAEWTAFVSGVKDGEFDAIV
ncbi:DUF397 domain-containing protein [Catenulispora yoronensis]|uniref:DUF397 domain-containing protein n=1 Tax=Catenulispora yoronensis TaxID=450799 RepID=A0ABP5G1N7_9ACTN